MAMLFASMPSLPDLAGPRKPVPTLPDIRISLNLQALTQRNSVCDASCQKSSSDASQNLDPPPQPNENEQLKTSLLKLPHTPTRCVTRAGCLPALRRNRRPELFFARLYAGEPPQCPRVRATHRRIVLACGIARWSEHYPQS